MALRLTIEEAQRRYPDMVKGQAWRGTQVKCCFLCEKHGEYKQQYNSHAYCGCPKCGYEKVGKINSISIKEMERRCPDMIKGQKWAGVLSEYKFLCKKHGVYEQSFNSHDQGRGCQICGREKNREAQCLTIEEIERRYPEFVRGQEWRGAAVKYRFLCKKHGEYSQSANKHQCGRRCPKCKPDVLRKHFIISIREAEKRCLGMIKGQRWLGNKANYRFLCKKHGEYLQGYSNHRRGSRCPRCLESRGELIVASFLKASNFLFERQRTFDGCRNKGLLRFDFYIPKLRTLIEYQGRQHYSSVRRWGGINSFRQIQKHDRIKRRWARAKGYRLIAVPSRIRRIGKYLSVRLSSLH
jgi:hypothetical protein